MVAVLDEQGLPREYGGLSDTPKAVAEILAAITGGKEVAAAVGWPVLFIVRKATEAELTA